MGQKSFPLLRKGPRRLLLKWERNYQNMVVTADGRQLAVIPGGKTALKQGQQIVFGKGHRLGVRLLIGFTEGLDVTLNHRLLPGSKSDPKNKLNAACAAL